MAPSLVANTGRDPSARWGGGATAIRDRLVPSSWLYANPPAISYWPTSYRARAADADTNAAYDDERGDSLGAARSAIGW
jgi:hypothetical protein